MVCPITAFLLDITENINIAYMNISYLDLMQGAIQSLTRSTYSKLLPDTEDHATYFSFYDVTEKIAIVLGTFIYGLIICNYRFYAMECIVFGGFLFSLFLSINCFT